MNNKLKIILPVLLVSSSAFILFQLKKDSILISTTSNSSDIRDLKSDISLTPTSFQKLNIFSKHCIGCGKCSRIDSTHFEMVNNVATVISSTNLNSSKLTMAINNCPVQVITLE